MPNRLLKKLLGLTVAVAVIAFVGMAGQAQPSPKASAGSEVAAIIGRIVHRNSGLSSYEAHARLDVRQVNFPYVHPVLDGFVYFSSPGYTIYDFPHTPFYLKGITKVEGAVGLANRWPQCYDITIENQPDVYILHMAPKIRGEVADIDVTVAKKGAELQHFEWHYHNPGDHISLDQTYAVVNGYSVVTQQQTDVTIHHIRAKGMGTFDNFQYNVPVPTPTPTPSDPLHHCDN